MKKTIITLLSVIALGFSANAQESDLKAVSADNLAQSKEDRADGWLKGGTLGLNFSQVALNNWAGGGQNTIAGTGLLSLFRNYQKGRTAWDNSLDLAYGLTSLDDGPLFKSDDRIELNSKYGRQFKEGSKWYYGGLLNFRTQFAEGLAAPGSSSIISNFLAPAYLTTALGIDYRPNDYFSVFISPLSSKSTIVNIDSLATRYGVDAGKNIRHEVGGLLQMKFQKDIFENVNFKSQLQLFSNYLNNPQNVDVFWDNLLSMKVNKFITASVAATLIYDHDINLDIDSNGDGTLDAKGPRTQFKEAFNIGFAYAF